MRVVAGEPILTLTDYRETRVVRDRFTSSLEYDAEFGWRMKKNLDLPLIKTMPDYGIRQNGDDDRDIRTGGVLVVGASFTVGSEVANHESWPAHLENLMGVPVINGAQSAYGSDQIIMWAEKYLDLIQPKILVVDLLYENILTAAYSFYVRPKPFFVLKDGKLEVRNQPVPRDYRGHTDEDPFQQIFGHSYLAHVVMSNYFQEYWFSGQVLNTITENTDPVSVTCALLDRLKKRTDQDDIRVLLSFQYVGATVMTETTRLTTDLLVEDCAKAMGIQVIDDFAQLRAMYLSDPEQFRAHYNISQNGVFGHKTSLGNLQVARNVKAALSEPPVTAPSPSPVVTRSEQNEPDGKNLIARSEDLHKIVGKPGIVEVSFLGSRGGEPNQYRVGATGPEGEHYFGIGGLPIQRGTFVFSMEAKPESGRFLKIQMLDANANGIAGYFDLNRGEARADRMGFGMNLSAEIDEIGGGWSRLTVSADYPDRATDEAPGSINIQMATGMRTLHFNPSGETLLIRALKLERGRSATPYEAALATR